LVAAFATHGRWRMAPLASSSSTANGGPLLTSGCSPRLAEIGFADQLGTQQIRGFAREHDLAGLQDKASVRDAQRHIGVLLDDENRRALSIDLLDHVEYLLDQLWRQAHRRLIHAQQS